MGRAGYRATLTEKPPLVFFFFSQKAEVGFLRCGDSAAEDPAADLSVWDGVCLFVGQSQWALQEFACC